MGEQTYGLEISSTKLESNSRYSLKGIEIANQTYRKKTKRIHNTNNGMGLKCVNFTQITTPS